MWGLTAVQGFHPNAELQSVCGCKACRGLCVRGYASPDHHWPKPVMLNDAAGSIRFSTASPFNICHMSSGQKSGQQWTWQFLFSMANGLHSAGQWQDPPEDVRHSGHSHEVCWFGQTRSHQRAAGGHFALAVLSLFAPRSTYWSHRWVIVLSRSPEVTDCLLERALFVSSSGFVFEEPDFNF